MLADARTLLQAQTARIVDADLRRRFLNDVAHHRAIVAAWENGSSYGTRA